MIRVTLQELLTNRNLSLRELSRRTSTHPDVLSRFSRQATTGVSYDLVNRICQALDCSVGDLLKYEPTAHQISFFEE